jgi:ribonuclease P protein component
LYIASVKNTLSRLERLKSRKLIEQLFNEGKSFSIFPLRVLYRFPEMQDTVLKAGFSVSSRSFKKAVDRNRIKRLLREAYRRQKHELYRLLEEKGLKMDLFFIYTGKEMPDYELISGKLGLTLTKLSKQIQ